MEKGFSTQNLESTPGNAWWIPSFHLPTIEHEGPIIFRRLGNSKPSGKEGVIPMKKYKKGIVIDDSELERERKRFEQMKKEYLEKVALKKQENRKKISQSD